MKDNIVKAAQNIQLGGMPEASSVEHLVTKNMDENEKILWQRKPNRLHEHLRQRGKGWQ